VFALLVFACLRDRYLVVGTGDDNGEVDTDTHDDDADVDGGGDSNGGDSNAPTQ
jgi:hypothetical protein